MSAGQAITLIGGPVQSTFKLQSAALTTLRTFVLAKLGDESVARPPSQLDFKRRAFVKVSNMDRCRHFKAEVERQVRPGDKGLVAPTIDVADKRSVEAAKLFRQWKLAEGVRIGIQEGGKLQPADHRAIRRGDFVDVVATLNIVNKRDVTENYIHIGLNPIQVVRLASMHAVKRVKEVEDSPTAEEKKMAAEQYEEILAMQKRKRLAVLADEEL